MIKEMVMLPNGRMMALDHFGREVIFDDPDSDLPRHNPPRSKYDRNYSYSYDPFTIWGGQSSSCNGSDWVDHMVSRDRKKYEALIEKIFVDAEGKREGVFVQGCNGQKIQQFYREFTGNHEIVLTRVVEFCNISNGYPTWRIDYHIPPKKEQQGE